MANEERGDGSPTSSAVVLSDHLADAHSHSWSSLGHCVHTCSLTVPQWATTQNEWNSDYRLNHPQAQDVFIKGFQGKPKQNQKLKFIIFFKLRKKGCQGRHLAKKWKVRPLKALFIHPKEISSYFRQDHRRLGYILYFLFRSVKKYLKVHI